MSANLQIPQERAHTFAFCNLSAPSMSQGPDLPFFGACASCLAQGQNLTAVILPQLACKKGQLHIQSRKIENIFIDRGLNVECKCAIAFKEKCNNRENRPWCTMFAVLCPWK